MPNPTPDFSIFDGQEMLAYVPGVGATLDDVPALRRPLTQSRQRNVERYIELQMTDVVFHAEGTQFSGISPAAGDTIVDRNNVQYEVLFVEFQTLGNTLAIVARPIVV